MKKIILMIIVSCLLFSLFACKEDKKKVNVINVEATKNTNKTQDNDVIGGLYIKPLTAERTKKDIIGIKLDLENKSKENIILAGMFTCMGKDNHILEEYFPIEENLINGNINNVNSFPPGAKWTGYIYYKTSLNKVTLFFDDFMGNDKKFNLVVQ